MPQITMSLRPQGGEDMLGICALLVDVVTSPDNLVTLGDEVRENLDAVDAATLLSLADLSTVLQVLVAAQAAQRGGRDVLLQQAVDSGQAVWADAPPST